MCCIAVPADLPGSAARPQVVSVQQRHRWDCGLACVMMVLPETRRRHFIDNFATVCREEGFGKRCVGSGLAEPAWEEYIVLVGGRCGEAYVYRKLFFFISTLR